MTIDLRVHVRLICLTDHHGIVVKGNRRRVHRTAVMPIERYRDVKRRVISKCAVDGCVSRTAAPGQRTRRTINQRE
jgi:hypothetical protein